MIGTRKTYCSTFGFHKMIKIKTRVVQSDPPFILFIKDSNSRILPLLIPPLYGRLVDFDLEGRLDQISMNRPNETKVPPRTGSRGNGRNMTISASKEKRFRIYLEPQQLRFLEDARH